MLTQPPLPEGGAPGRCAVALLRGLMAHGLEVRALAARRHFAVPGDPPADLPVEIVPVPAEPGGWRRRVGRLRRPGGELAAGVFGERVREAARDAEIVHLEETETAWCDVGVSTPSVVHLHYLVRRDRPLGPPWRQESRYAIETYLSERAAMRRHRYLVASSPEIADVLGRTAPLAHVVHAPLSVDPRYYNPATLDGPPRVGILGTAQWAPTAAAMQRLVENIWPQIRAHVPDARLLVAGRGTELLDFTDRGGVECLGELPSAAEFLRELSVLLFPLRRGSGMKVKVLEAMACGLPVVTTRAGAEGVEPNTGIVVAEDDASLAAATISLLVDPTERAERGRSSRDLYERRFTPEAATEPLLGLYARMLGTVPP